MFVVSTFNFHVDHLKALASAMRQRVRLADHQLLSLRQSRSQSPGLLVSLRITPTHPSQIDMYDISTSKYSEHQGTCIQSAYIYVHFIYMHIYIYIHILLCTYYIYIYVHTIHKYTFLYNIYIYIHIYVYVHIIHTHIHMYIYIYIDLDIYI